MTARREFSPKVKAAIVMRTMNDRGFPVCEGCSGVLKLKGYMKSITGLPRRWWSTSPSP